MKDLLSPLVLAVKFEVEGREYFLKAAKKVTHPFGKKMFETLAQDENKHILKIKEIKESLKDNDSWPDDVPPVSKGESLTTVFETAKKEIEKEIRPTESDIEVIKQALELEDKGYKFYNDLAEETKDPKAKKFYELLANEEKGHFALLQKTEEFLTSPGDWFCENERPIFEG